MQEGSSPKRHRRVERGVYERPTQTGRVFEVCYQDADARTRWATAKTLPAARRLRARLMASAERGEVIPRGRVRFGELAEQWFEAKSPKLRKRTSDYYRRSLDLVLLPRFGLTRISNIGPDEVARLIADLEREGLHAIDPAQPVRPLGRASIDNYLKPLHATLKLALRRRLIGSDPFAALTADERPKRGEKEPPHEWTSEEVAALLDASERLAAKKESRFDYSLLLRVVVMLGLRLGEVLGLQWQDFDKDGGYLHVRRQWLRSGEYGPTKTAAGVREIALPPELRDALIALRLRSRFSADDDPVFASRIGSPLSHRNVTRRGWEAARDEAKLPKSVSFHDLRGAAASQLIDAGLDVVTIAEIVGHGDRGATLLKHYAGRFNRQRKDEAVRAALAGGAD